MKKNEQTARKSPTASVLLFFCFLLCLTSLVSCVTVDPNENAPTGNGAPSATQASEFSTSTPTATPTDVPTTAPTATSEIESPTITPTATPTDVPTTAPTDAPTVEPTDAPTTAPTSVPTEVLTAIPTAPAQDTSEPLAVPTLPHVEYATNEDGKFIMEISEERGEELELKFIEMGSIWTTSFVRKGVANVGRTVRDDFEINFEKEDIAAFKVYDMATGEEMTVKRDSAFKSHFSYTENKNGTRSLYLSIYVTVGREAGTYWLVLLGHDGAILYEDVWNIDEVIVGVANGYISQFGFLRRELPDDYAYALPDGPFGHLMLPGPDGRYYCEYCDYSMDDWGSQKSTED